jgi:hypothetical protein
VVAASCSGPRACLTLQPVRHPPAADPPTRSLPRGLTPSARPALGHGRSLPGRRQWLCGSHAWPPNRPWARRLRASPVSFAPAKHLRNAPLAAVRGGSNPLRTCAWRFTSSTDLSPPAILAMGRAAGNGERPQGFRRILAPSGTRTILKTRSPSCSVGKTYIDRVLAPGDGVFAALLRSQGISLSTEAAPVPGTCQRAQASRGRLSQPLCRRRLIRGNTFPKNKEPTDEESMLSSSMWRGSERE